MTLSCRDIELRCDRLGLGGSTSPRLDREPALAMGLGISGTEDLREVRDGVEGESLLEVLEVLLGLFGSYLAELLSMALMDKPDFRGLDRMLMKEACEDDSSIMERFRVCISVDVRRGLRGREKDGVLDEFSEGRAVGEGKAGSASCTVVTGSLSDVRLLVDCAKSLRV